MANKICTKHDKRIHCSCGLGNLYRFIEPVVLQLLHVQKRSCGYTLFTDLQKNAFTDNEIEKAALYRNLRQLEKNGKVASSWETGNSGPDRRVYRLTRGGEKLRLEWIAFLGKMSRSMSAFVNTAHKSATKTKTRARRSPAR